MPPRYPRVDRKAIIRRGLRGRTPRRTPPVATPQELAGSTVSQTTTNPKTTKLAKGLAIRYVNGKPVGFVRISGGTTGIAQGKGIQYDASGKPSFVDWPPSGPGGPGGSGGSGPPVSTTSNTQGSPAFGDWAYQQATGPEGILGGVDRGVGNQNFQDQQYLMQMGYTPEQAAQAIQSRQYSITDPSNPSGTQLSKDVGQLTPGSLDWNQVDVSNPYSRAGMLVKSYRGAVQGTTTGMAAGGHGRSGAALTAQQGNTTNFGAGQAQWNQDLTGYTFGSNEARTGIGYQANQGIVGQVADFNTRQQNAPVIESPEGYKTSVPATGSFILGNQAGNGLPSYNEWIAQYGGDSRKFPQLANGWSVEIKDGRIVRFIPPGGA